MGTVLHAKRNTVREDYVKGTRLVIKSFGGIYLANRIRYTYFYPSKAKRAFENAKLLLQKGFNTPRPIAYLEIRRNGLIDQMYFICEFTDFQPVNVMNEISAEKISPLLLEIAQHTFRLHQNNIYHLDYSSGNILFRVTNDKYELALIDNNRMKFSAITFKKGIRNFARLDLPIHHLTLIAKEYSRLWNVAERIGIQLLFRYKGNYSRRRLIKKSLKKAFSRYQDFMRN